MKHKTKQIARNIIDNNGRKDTLQDAMYRLDAILQKEEINKVKTILNKVEIDLLLQEKMEQILKP